jgi:hypothetical protein
VERRGFFEARSKYKVLTVPSAFPALGRGVNTDIKPARRTCWLKNDVSSPLAICVRDHSANLLTESTGGSQRGQLMDIGILAGLAMLVLWAIGTFMYEAPGWIHLLLSAGVFLIIYRIVVRGTPGVDTTTKK